MSIRIEITGENTQEIAQSILQMAFMIAPRLAQQPQAAPAEAVAAETVQPARKPGRTKKADAPTIEHDESEVKTDVRGADGGAGQQEPAAEQSVADAAGKGESEADVSGDPAKGEAAAEVDAVAESLMNDEKPAPKDVVDPIRQHVINDYLNVVTESLPVRKDLYKALLDQFGVPAITALRPSQVAEFVAVVDAKIAGALKV